MANRNDAGPRRAVDLPQRDFLYQRRLVSVRPFMADDGAPGLGLRFEGGDMIAVRIEGPLLGILHRAIGRLLEDPRAGVRLGGPS